MYNELFLTYMHINVCVKVVTTSYRESFEAETFRGKLYMQTFARNFCETPHTFS